MARRIAGRKHKLCFYFFNQIFRSFSVPFRIFGVRDYFLHGMIQDKSIRQFPNIVFKINKYGLGLYVFDLRNFSQTFVPAHKGHLPFAVLSAENYRHRFFFFIFCFKNSAKSIFCRRHEFANNITEKIAVS